MNLPGFFGEKQGAGYMPKSSAITISGSTPRLCAISLTHLIMMGGPQS
jgi:hypothetical protein